MMQKGALIQAYESYNKQEYVVALKKLSSAESYTEASPELKAEIYFLKASTLDNMGRNAEAEGMYKYVAKYFPRNQYGYAAQEKLNKLAQESKNPGLMQKSEKINAIEIETEKSNRMTDYEKTANKQLTEQDIFFDLRRIAMQDANFANSFRIQNEAYRSGKKVVSPKIISSIKPYYLTQNKEAFLRCFFVVDTNGKAKNVKCLSYLTSVDEIFRTSGEEALRRWEFTPGTIDSKPIDFAMSVPIRFKKP
jgi:hypothetical protein